MKAVRLYEYGGPENLKYEDNVPQARGFDQIDNAFNRAGAERDVLGLLLSGGLT